MPLYEYRCSSCGDVFEVKQKFSDEPLSVHEKCGGKVVRLISAPGLHFKGSGWYITDYARASQNKSDGKRDSDKPSSDKPAKTEKTESKSGSDAPAPTSPAAKS